MISMKKVKRLQFDFSEEAARRLDELKELTESTTNAEVIRRALRLFEFIVHQTKNGYEVELTKNGKTVIFDPLI